MVSERTSLPTDNSTAANQRDTISPVLEGDVDMEVDTLNRLRNIWPLLPSDWDIVILGIVLNDFVLLLALFGFTGQDIADQIKLITLLLVARTAWIPDLTILPLRNAGSGICST